MSKTKIGFIAVIILTLTSCVSVPIVSNRERANQLEIGDSQEKVVLVMSSPINSTSIKDIQLWEYESISSIGICEYHHIWFWKGKLVDRSVYNNNSIYGCEIGRKKVDWSNVLEKVELNDDFEEVPIG